MHDSMPSPLEVLHRLESLLTTWFESGEIILDPEHWTDREVLSFRLRLRGVDFAGLLRSRGDTASVSTALQVFQNVDLPQHTHFLLVVPYMGDVGARLCHEAGASWIDLSGNAHIETDSLFVHVEGKSNEFKRPGRPSNAFAPKSSRISRFLLQHPDEYFTQRELAEATDLGDGYTSKIVRRLEEMELIARKGSRKIGVADPALLLDAWWETYDFSKHQIIRGTVAARHSRELLERLIEPLRDLEGNIAATGLAAAWMMTRFASFRITTFYLEHSPPEDWKRSIGLREDPKGANLWLVVPSDYGVFHGSTQIEGVPCVHPVQAYLDLKGHPERSEEAANSIRHELLTWKAND